MQINVQFMSKCVCLCTSTREMIHYILKGSLLLVFNILTWLVGDFLVVVFVFLGLFCFLKQETLLYRKPMKVIHL